MAFLVPQLPRAFVPLASRAKWSMAGDSIMVGNGWTSSQGGYRATLLALLYTYYGYRQNPNVVGSDYANSFSYPGMGAAGINSDQLHNTYVSIQAPLYTPDYAVMCIGSNDAAQGVATNTYVTNVGLVLDDFRSANPNCRIILMNCPDRTGFTTEINAYNVALSTAVLARSDYLSGLIKYVDINTALGSAAGANFGDNIHPNSLGYPIMANAIYTAFLTF